MVLVHFYSLPLLSWKQFFVSLKLTGIASEVRKPNALTRAELYAVCDNQTSNPSLSRLMTRSSFFCGPRQHR